MAVVFFGRRSVANTNANGEHQTISWTPSWGMSIHAVERKDPHSKCNPLLNLDFLGSCDTYD
jgi:hypothetical protein